MGPAQTEIERGKPRHLPLPLRATLVPTSNVHGTRGIIGGKNRNPRFQGGSNSIESDSPCSCSSREMFPPKHWRKFSRSCHWMIRNGVVIVNFNPRFDTNMDALYIIRFTVHW